MDKVYHSYGTIVQHQKKKTPVSFEHRGQPNKETSMKLATAITSETIV